MAHYTYASYDIDINGVGLVSVRLHSAIYSTGFELVENIDAFFFVNNPIIQCCFSRDTFSQL